MIHVLRCGYDSRHQAPFELSRKTGVPNYELLLIKTPAYFNLPDGHVEVAPNTAILYDRNTYVCYGSIGSYFNNDWLHFDFIDEPSLVEALALPLNTPLSLPNMRQLSAYMRLLTQETHNTAVHRAEILDTILRGLLYSLDAQLRAAPPTLSTLKYASELTRMRTNIYNAPHQNWTVEALADSIHLSVSYFQHLYKERFGVSCIRDVIQARLDSARFYLTTSDIPIQNLATVCGYDNELHFMRQFKKFEGLTPTQYRETASATPYDPMR